MSMLFRCSHCGVTYRVPERLSGKLARCRHCHEVSRIAPGAAGAAGPADAGRAEHHAGDEVHHDVEEVAESSLPQKPAARATVDDILEAVRQETRESAAAPPEPAVTAVPERPRRAEIENRPAPLLSWRMQLAACGVGLLIALIVLAMVLPWRRWTGQSRPQASAAAAGAAPVLHAHHSAADAAGQSDAGRAHYVRCVANLERLGHALRVYSELNRGCFPYELGRLAVSRSASFTPVPAECFICPATGKKVPPGLSGEQLVHWLAKNGDYVFRGAGCGPGVGGIPPIVIHEKWESDNDEGVNVLDDQFTVRFMSLADLKSALRQQHRHYPRRELAME